MSGTDGRAEITERAVRVQLAATDLDPDTGRARLSYRRAAELLPTPPAGGTLHDLDR
jgi:integrase/recombinase XerC/integrase/recombinase XerD